MLRKRVVKFWQERWKALKGTEPHEVFKWNGNGIWSKRPHFSLHWFGSKRVCSSWWWCCGSIREWDKGSWLRSLRRNKEAKNRGNICSERFGCIEYFGRKGSKVVMERIRTWPFCCYGRIRWFLNNIGLSSKRHILLTVHISNKKSKHMTLWFGVSDDRDSQTQSRMKGER